IRKAGGFGGECGGIHDHDDNRRADRLPRPGAVNHLAHALLAGDNEALQLGGLMGDFVRGPAASVALPAPVITGIRMHRAIDVYTDSHPQVLAAKALLPAPYRRYAGILLDMWFDRCLARDFSHWSGQSVEQYSARLRALLWRR